MKRYYKVFVAGYGTWNPTGRQIDECHKWELLIDASTDSEAMDAAELHAETIAPMGPKWHTFEALSATTVDLPLVISSAKLKTSRWR